MYSALQMLAVTIMVQHDISCIATYVATSSDFTCVGRVHDGNSLANISPYGSGFLVKLNFWNAAVWLLIQYCWALVLLPS